MELDYEPKILDLRSVADFAFFKEVQVTAIVVDAIQSQLSELIELQHPKVDLEDDEIDELVEKHLNGIAKEKYGLWVYYPWSRKLVHIVNEDEFIELRTSRNKYKITIEEQAVLQQKTIGIIGLSVGHAIATTIASERICSEIRLADFDFLELTNLNRIKTGIGNLGLKKTVLAAREIAEIDPFIKVKCYHEGIDDDNLDDFLTTGGKLDVCLEECDGFYAKFKVRLTCKELGIPVIMDTSDKGLLDVERFDLEPDREIFHGLTHVEDLEKLRGLTTDEKIPYLYQIINEHDMSIRLRASLIEVGESIKSWPQLSSAVTMGSGITVDVTRRMLLGDFVSSGRYSIDPEQLINDEQVQDGRKEINEQIPLAAKEDFGADIQSSVSSTIDKATIESMVADAIKAPSGGNSQPWKWVFNGNDLFLFLDTARCSPYTDLNNWGAVLALGCATENLILSANSRGLGVVKEHLDDSEKFSLKFSFTSMGAQNIVPIYDSTLYDAVAHRQTNRNNSELKALDVKHKEDLFAAVNSIDGAELTIVENREDIRALADIIAEGDMIRFLNKFLYEELMMEIRWDKKHAVEQPYGVELDLFDITAKDKIGFKIAGSWKVASFVKKIGGNALGDLSRKLLLNGSAVALITMPKIDNMNFFNGGIAIERFWLTAAKHDVAIHPFAALSYFFTRLETNSVDLFSVSEVETLKRLRIRWNEILKIAPGRPELIFCKLSYAPRAADSQRIKLDQVLSFK